MSWYRFGRYLNARAGTPTPVLYVSYRSALGIETVTHRYAAGIFTPTSSGSTITRPASGGSAFPGIFGRLTFGGSGLPNTAEVTSTVTPLVEVAAGASDTIFRVNGLDFLKVEATRLLCYNHAGDFNNIQGEGVLFKIKTHPMADIVGFYSVADMTFHFPKVTITETLTDGTTVFAFYAGSTLVGTLGMDGLNTLQLDESDLLMYAAGEEDGVELIFSDDSPWGATP